MTILPEPDCPHPTVPTLISASGGLIRFSFPDSSSICNVLTKSAKSMEFPTYPFESVCLILTYRRLLFMDTSSSCSVLPQLANWVLVYDPVTEKWARFYGYDPIPMQNSQQEAIFFDRSLHFAMWEPFLIVGFNVGSGRWRESVAELPQSLVLVCLVSSSDRKDGSLYLVGGIECDEISKRSKVWELKGSGGGGEWAEVAALPELMCRS